MLDYKKVLHNSVFYTLGRRLIVDFWFNTVFFRKVEVVGLENIPKDKPVLIAPIHRNAFIDDAAVLCTRKDNPVFLARADIFEKKWLAKIFIFFRMVPVFRIRDGKHKLANNDMTFDVGAHVLENDNILIVFPEAAHTENNRMLPLKKGAIRIAFLAAQRTNFIKDIFIVPTGLYYDNIFHYRHKVLVQYGKPINILDYKDAYLDNPQKAMLKVREDLNRELIKLSIHIAKDNDDYEAINAARGIFRNYIAKKSGESLKSLKQAFDTDKLTVEILEKASEEKPDKFQEFKDTLQKYLNELERNKLRDYVFDRPWPWWKLIAASFLSVFFLPLYLLLWINFFIPACSPELIVKKFKDKIFHASVRFVGSLFLVLFWAILGGLLLGIFVKWWIGLLFFFAQPFLFILWLDWRRLWKKILGNWRFRLGKFNEIRVLRDKLFGFFNDFFSNFVAPKN